jgi:hypothetical protein
LHCASHTDGFQAENPPGRAAHGGRKTPGGAGAILTGRIMYSRSGFLRLCLFFLSLLTSPLPALVVAILAYERCERGTARPHPNSSRLLSPGSGEQLLELLMLSAALCAERGGRRRRRRPHKQVQSSLFLSPSPPHLLGSHSRERAHAPRTLSARGVSQTPRAPLLLLHNSAPAPQNTNSQNTLKIAQV